MFGIDFTAIPRKVIAAIVGAVLIALLAWAAFHWWQSSVNAGAEARLATSQGQAVTESAKDAIRATGAVSARSEAEDSITRDNDHAIRQADGADAPVSRAVNDAGIAGLCKRRAYRCNPKCVQRAVAAGVANASAGCPAAGR